MLGAEAANLCISRVAANALHLTHKREEYYGHNSSRLITNLIIICIYLEVSQDKRYMINLRMKRII